jgi:hypothetical protein
MWDPWMVFANVLMTFGFVSVGVLLFCVLGGE